MILHYENILVMPSLHILDVFPFIDKYFLGMDDIPTSVMLLKIGVKINDYLRTCMVLV